MFWMTRYVKRGRDNLTANENLSRASVSVPGKRRRWRLERQDAVMEGGPGEDEDPTGQLSPVDSGLGVEVLPRTPRLPGLGSALHSSPDWSSIPEDEGEARLVHTFSARTKFDGAPCVAADITLTNHGDIVLSDEANKKVKVFDVSGQLKVECCVPLYYSGGLVQPRGVAALETGEILVCDLTNGNIKLFTPEGRLLTMFGKPMTKPSAISVNSRGHIVVVDEARRDVYLFKSLTDKKVTRLFREGQGEISVGQPTAVCLTTADDIVVYDITSGKIVVCDSAGKYTTDFDLRCLQENANCTDESNNSSSKGSTLPEVSALCNENHNTVLLADKSNNRIASVNIKTGRLSRDVIFKTRTISKPVSMATNEDGLLVVLEENQQTVKVFKYNR